MELTTALEAARRNSQAVLVTIRPDGRPHATNVLQHTGDDGLLRVSITADRVKYRNLLAKPWAALHIGVENFWSFVVLEGAATLSDVAADPQDATVAELVELYRALSGEHRDWDGYRRAMVADRRVVLRVRPDRAYGQLG